MVAVVVVAAVVVQLKKTNEEMKTMHVDHTTATGTVCCVLCATGTGTRVHLFILYNKSQP